MKRRRTSTTESSYLGRLSEEQITGERERGRNGAKERKGRLWPVCTLASQRGRRPGEDCGAHFFPLCSPSISFSLSSSCFSLFLPSLPLSLYFFLSFFLSLSSSCFYLCLSPPPLFLFLPSLPLSFFLSLSLSLSLCRPILAVWLSP